MRNSAASLALVTAGLLATAVGCTPEAHRYIRFPNFVQPGWAHQQRQEAIEHDPYPLDDVGPEVVGGRPREYARPLNEVERARRNTLPPVAMQPIPVQPVPMTPPPVVTGPYPPAAIPAVPPFPVQQRSPY
jgi:hypothetical protein